MKFPYGVASAVCLLLSVPLALYALSRWSRDTEPVVRFATYNVALHRATAGELLAELRGGRSQAGRRVAEVVQRVQPDVLLLCEVDRDAAGEVATVLAREYFAVSQNGGRPVVFENTLCEPVNTGEPAGVDVDGDGTAGGAGDTFGFGAFPGQYGMVLLSRHPILRDRVRTFRTLPWSAMPEALRPGTFYDDATWARLRLSSKSHWDVPIGIGEPQRGGRVVHALCSHPTPPVFDGPEDRNGCRNHDEIRFWVDYLTPGRDAWIVDDAGRRGGLAADAAFVVLGDLNCDPADGDGRREALRALLAHPRVQDPAPQGPGGKEAADRQWGRNRAHAGDPALDTADFPDEAGTGPGNLRVDYALPARSLRVVQSRVWWPPANDAAHRLAEVSDHRPVFVDVALAP